MENGGFIVVMFLVLGGGSMVTKMWTEYNRTRVEMARIKADHRTIETPRPGRDVEALRAELARTQQELKDLRDTSTQYDISFDTALTRLEHRVAHVERRTGTGANDLDNQTETITLTGR